MSILENVKFDKYAGRAIRTLAIAVAALATATLAVGQRLDATITVDAALGSVVVEGKFLNGDKPRHLAFRSAVSGNAHLAERIDIVSVAGADGPLEIRRLAAGEFAASGEISTFTYKVSTLIPPNRIATAHASWTDADQGILMADDLLPNIAGDRSARLRFVLPAGWDLVAGEQVETGRVVRSRDFSQTVVLVGSGFREIGKRGRGPRLLIGGRWVLSDEEMRRETDAVFDAFTNLFGALPAPRPVVVLTPFPKDSAASNIWEAETRGRTVLVVSGDSQFKQRSLERFREQVRHELFHLWLPNALAIKGYYAWFYEGFALYQSLKTALRLGHLNFDDVLAVLSRAAAADRGPACFRSLTDPSIDPSIRYARGLLLAFLSDLAILVDSGGTRDASSMLRDFYTKYADDAKPPMAEEAALEALPSDMIRDLVKQPKRLTLGESLTAAGLIFDGAAIRPIPNPDGRQKEILARLSYNRWRNK